MNDGCSGDRRHHLLIGGTGRAGTSYLVKLLQRCGLETSARQDSGGIDWHKDAEAGMEERFSNSARQPYLLKSPWLYKDINKILSEQSVVIDEVIIPVRKLAATAASRIVLEKQHLLRSEHPDQAYDDEVGYVAGGSVHSLRLTDQERMLAVSFFNLVERLVRASIPIRFISYPDVSLNADYAFASLRSLLPPSIDRDGFDAIHQVLSKEGSARIETELADLLDDGIDGPHPTSGMLSLIAASRELKRLNDVLDSSRDETRRLQVEVGEREAENRRLMEQNHYNYSRVIELEAVIKDIHSLIATHNPDP